MDLHWFSTKINITRTRDYQRRDRDLAVYRARMDRASELTKSLITTSDSWYKLSSLATATLNEKKTQEFQSLAMPLIKETAFSRINLAIILFDPQFRTLRDLLRPSLGEKLYTSLKDSTKRITSFNEKTYNLLPSDPDIVDQVQFISVEGKIIGDELVSVANGFADAFAALDNELTKES